MATIPPPSQHQSLKLKSNPNLINPNFDGYRLSTKNIPSYRLNLKKECISKSVNESMNKSNIQTQYNMDKIIACNSHNYLTISPFNDKIIFYVDTGYNIMALFINNENLLPDPYPVAKMKRVRRPDVAPTVFLVESEKSLVVTSDGNETIYVWRIEKLQKKQEEDGNDDDEIDYNFITSTRWKLIFSQNFEESYQNCGLRIRDVAFDKNQNNLNVAVESIDNNGRVKLDCFRTNLSDENPKFQELLKLKSVDICVNLKYVKLLANDSLIFISDKPLLNNRKPTPKKYTFEQSPAHVKVTFHKNFNTSKNSDNDDEMDDNDQTGVSNSSIIYDPAKNVLKMCTKSSENDEEPSDENQNLSISGELFADLTPNSIKIDQNKLTFTAEKANKDIIWPLLFNKDENGNTPEATYYSCLDQNNFKNPKDIHGQYEEVDFDANNANSAIVVYNYQKGMMTFSSNISGQNLLFSLDNSGVLCLQSDVDGFLYEISSNASTLSAKHIATLNAISYVINGKPNLQFKSCSPNFEICVLIDRRIRAYVYHQNSNVAGDAGALRNRKLGRNVSTISTQQLVTLPQDLAKEDIVGMRVVNDRFYVLTTSSLLVFKV